jgi:ribosome maturation factor RimP
MIDKKLIENFAQQASDEAGLFVVEVTVGSNNNISVTVDGDHGVNINQIVEVSKFIENNLDREEEDFELGVTSFGIDHPIVLLRQYQKYIDKPVQLLLKDDTTKRGILISADSSTLVLQEEEIKKNRKSKKMLLGETIEIPMDIIKQAKGLILF